MSHPLRLNPDRLFPVDADTRGLARRLYAEVKDLPIISPHGHTDPSWFALNESFANPAELLITPDHYVFRMLHSQGMAMEDLGVPRADGGPVETDPRTIWRRFAENYHLFRGTPSRMWHDWVYAEAFGIDVRLSAETADHYYDVIDAALKTDAFRPRALFDRYNIEVLTTTESPTDTLEHHKTIRASGWKGRVLTAYRPDPVLDPDYEGFRDNLKVLAEQTGCDTTTWAGYLDSAAGAARLLRRRWARPRPTTATRPPSPPTCRAPRSRLCSPRSRPGRRRRRRRTVPRPDADRNGRHVGRGRSGDAAAPGSFRNHSATVFNRFGRDKGCDIPTRTDYVRALKPLLDRFGSDTRLTLILFTLDETSYSRELAPLAGHYPALKLGPSWWFHDSPEGMRRFREQTTETAGFYNTVGFNDDTRAFLSIPARHDVARRMDCGFLAKLVVEHRMEEDEAHELAHALTYGLVKAAYKL
jgi:glucuronate isomerase